MIHVDKESKTVINKVLSWSSYQRWCQPMIRVDSMLSVEYSQELSQLDKRSELWDLTTNQEARMT